MSSAFFAGFPFWVWVRVCLPGACRASGAGRGGGFVIKGCIPAPASPADRLEKGRDVNTDIDTHFKRKQWITCFYLSACDAQAGAPAPLACRLPLKGGVMRAALAPTAEKIVQTEAFFYPPFSPLLRCGGTHPARVG